MLAPDNLCMDVGLRSNMDEAGYLPIAFLCNYENVAYFGALYRDIIDALLTSTTLEVDQQNEVVRVANNWKMVRPSYSIMGTPCISCIHYGSSCISSLLCCKGANINCQQQTVFIVPSS